MKKIILSFVLITTIGCSAQKKEATAVIDYAGNLIGIANKESFLQEPFNEWFTPNYDNYTLNEEVIESLKFLNQEITIKAFMGTWCEDSQDQTPVFYKILDEAKFNYENLEFIAVDRDKSTPNNLQEGFDIERVPTFIFYKNGKEIGRIVEYPRETVEVDMLKIISGETYKHSYED